MEEGRMAEMQEAAEREVKDCLKKGELKDLRFRGRDRSGSMGLLDMWKRKREVTEGVEEGERRGGEEDYFKRSKKLRERHQKEVERRMRGRQD